MGVHRRGDADVVEPKITGAEPDHYAVCGLAMEAVAATRAA